MKRVTAVLLLVAMLASLAACSKTEQDETTTHADTTGTDTTVTETEPEETRPMHGLSEDLDFGGEEFNINARDWHSNYQFAEEATGDAMNDALYNRKIKTEEFLNVKIVQELEPKYAEVVNKIKNTVTAGDDVYDLCLIHSMASVSELVSRGMLYNFDILPNVDLDAEWWNRDRMDMLRLGKNTYYGVSDYVIPTPNAIFFNKELIVDNNMENPYELVYEGKWTLDKFSNMCLTVSRDVNGDGQYTKDDDVWGMTCNEYSKYVPFMTAAGQFLTSATADGRRKLDMYTEKTFHILEVLYNMINTASAVFVPDGMAEEDMVQMDTGRILFRLGVITDADVYRDCEVDVGFLPYPKYDEAQENYISNDGGSLMCIPLTIQQTEMVGATIEYLSWESENEVVPAYYDVTLSGKLARDEDSRNMLDLLFSNVAYEVGGNYFGFSGAFNQLFYVVGNMIILQDSADFASFYAKNEKSATAIIDKFYEALEKIEG